MTLEDVRALVLSADPQAMHYVHAKGRGAYTTWQETQRIGMSADDARDKGWAFMVDRFTQTEFDETAAAIEQVLSGAVGVVCRYRVDYERESGYIHHIFDCEGV